MEYLNKYKYIKLVKNGEEKPYTKRYIKNYIQEKMS